MKGLYGGVICYFLFRSFSYWVCVLMEDLSLFFCQISYLYKEIFLIIRFLRDLFLILLCSSPMDLARRIGLGLGNYLVS